MRKLILGGLAALSLAAIPLESASAQYHSRGWYGGHYYNRGWYGGAAVGAGVLGGVLLGGALASQANAGPPPAEGPVFLYPPNTRLGYCERQLPGFDADSGTYVAPNGRRARCP